MTDPVDHLARLAGIDLDPGERVRIARHLAELQKLIDALPDDTTEVGNPHAVELSLREDEPGAALPADVVAALFRTNPGSWLDLPPVREDDA